MRTSVVIMAGGQGERLWPKSTKQRPKQFLVVYGEQTLLQQTFRRSLNIAEVKDVYVVTPLEYSGIVREQLPELPFENIIVEPVGRGTAAAIGYAALCLKKRVSDTVMVVLPSDHVVLDERKFVEAIDAAVYGATVYDGLVTLGIVPTRAETSYGYIECTEEYYSAKVVDTGADRNSVCQGHTNKRQSKLDVTTCSQIDGKHRLIRAKRFTEKPSLDVAVKFVQTGRYMWNAGMFVWKTSTILDAIAKYAPDIGKALHEIVELNFQQAATAGGSMNITDVTSWSNSTEMAMEIHKVYAAISSESIDYAVMEKADRVFVVPTGFGWDDVGSWMAMERIRELDDNQNAIAGSALALNAHRNIIENDSQEKMIVACGVSDLVIVNADDAILIMEKSQADSIRNIRRAVMDIDEDTAGD